MSAGKCEKCGSAFASFSAKYTHKCSSDQVGFDVEFANHPILPLQKYKCAIPQNFIKQSLRKYFEIDQETTLIEMQLANSAIDGYFKLIEKPTSNQIKIHLDNPNKSAKIREYTINLLKDLKNSGEFLDHCLKMMKTKENLIKESTEFLFLFIEFLSAKEFVKSNDWKELKRYVGWIVLISNENNFKYTPQRMDKIIQIFEIHLPLDKEIYKYKALSKKLFDTTLCIRRLKFVLTISDDQNEKKQLRKEIEGIVNNLCTTSLNNNDTPLNRYVLIHIFGFLDLESLYSVGFFSHFFFRKKKKINI